MKNLKQVAQEFNLYQIQDIPQTHKNENCDWSISRNEKKVPSFLLSMDTIEAGVFFECRTQDPNTDKTIYHIENAYILIKGKDSDNFYMLMEDRNNKFRLFPYYSLAHKYQRGLSSDIRRSAIKDIKEPNQIGVFTAKKVNDWIEYCEKYLKAMETALNEVNDKNEAIETEIKNFIESLPNPEVQTYQNRTWVTTKNFEVIFTHYKDQKYLSKEITYKGGLNTIANIENSVK